MKTKPSYDHTKLLEEYKALIHNICQMEVKGKTMPYTSINGNMFSFLDSAGNLGLRLPTNILKDLIIKLKSKYCEAHGVILKKYLEISPQIFENQTLMKELITISYDFAKTLKPKKK